MPLLELANSLAQKKKPQFPKGVFELPEKKSSDSFSYGPLSYTMSECLMNVFKRTKNKVKSWGIFERSVKNDRLVSEKTPCHFQTEEDIPGNLDTTLQTDQPTEEIIYPRRASSVSISLMRSMQNVFEYLAFEKKNPSANVSGMYKLLS